MARFLRIVLNMLISASLLCFVATLVLFVRSRQIGDELMRDKGRWTIVLTSAKGVASLEAVDNSRPPPQFAALPRRGWFLSWFDPSLPRKRGRRLGDVFYVSLGRFEMWWGRPAPPGASGNLYFNWGLNFPYWILSTITLLLPALAAIVARRRRRAQRAQGLCPSCGYDLRATPHRCPECGAVPGAPT
jgi:hypothetical protein